MITEDYVSFETAKLLKEKGFNISCRFAYTEKGYEFNTCVCSDIPVYAYKPTLQMAMKWLREEHQLFIDLFIFHLDWLWSIYSIDKSIPVNNIPKIIKNSVSYTSYEEACEAAIKYCLENLV